MPVIESAIQRVRLTKKQHDRNEPQPVSYTHLTLPTN